jgi:transposase-like protein
MTIPQDKWEAILQAIMGGASMRQACRDAGIDNGLVYRAIREDDAFGRQYARATEVRADAMFDEMLEIADTPVEGETRKQLKDGTEEITVEDMLGHRRLQVDTRKWALARMNPRKYGEKVQVGGADDLPPVQLDATKLSTAALREIMAATSAGPATDQG